MFSLVLKCFVNAELNHSWPPFFPRQPLLLLLLCLPLLSSCSLTDCNSLFSTKSPSPAVSSPSSQRPVPGRYTSAHGCQQGRTTTPLTREPVKPTNPPCQRTRTPCHYHNGKQGQDVHVCRSVMVSALNKRWNTPFTLPLTCSLTFRVILFFTKPDPPGVEVMLKWRCTCNSFGELFWPIKCCYTASIQYEPSRSHVGWALMLKEDLNVLQLGIKQKFVHLKCR